MSMYHPTLLDGNTGDCTIALQVSLDRLSLAAKNAGDLLRDAGLAGAKGDTADDLHQALAVHTHLLHQFDVKIRTAECTDVCTVPARTAQGAYAAAAERQGDKAFGITVMPHQEARASPHPDLAAAHRAMKISWPLQEALKNPAMNIAIQSYARKHHRTNPTTDFKRQAANDRD